MLDALDPLAKRAAGAASEGWTKLAAADASASLGAAWGAETSEKPLTELAPMSATSAATRRAASAAVSTSMALA